jgi:hypothetical protein
MPHFFRVTLGLAIAAASSVSAAYAHFTYAVPLAEGRQVQVVFSDSLEPDKNVPIDRIVKTTLFCVDATGKQVPLMWTKGEHAILADLPGRDEHVVGGFSDYGFHQSRHTQNKPVWLKYYPKAILGRVSATDRVRLADTVPLEIVPVISGGHITFQAHLQGQPLAGAEFGILVPGESAGRKITADAQGVIPMGFDQPGKYGVRVGYIEPSTGELDGRKYEEIRHYATLVLDFVPVSR